VTRRLPAAWRRAALVALTVLLAGCDGGSVPSSSVPAGAPVLPAVLEAPRPGRAHDLDLQLHWRAAAVRQVLPPLDQPSAYRQQPELVALDGQGHRGVLLLPSLAGAPSTASFRVHVARDADCELVTWAAIDPTAQDPTDGVDFGVAVGESEPRPEAIPFERLPAGKSAAWREVRVDLAPYRDRVVWITLGSRDAHDRRGDRLIWGDPRVRLKRAADAPVVVDLGEPDPGAVRPAAVPWSEMNVFKAYYLFKDEDAASTFPASIPAARPWVRSLRLFSTLGGNFGPTLVSDYETQMGKNPSADSRRERAWAETYEFFHDGPDWAGKPVRDRFDWSAFDRMLDRAAATRLALHVHMAGAPELFTGGRGAYPSYHYNELPIVDEAGWRTYVDAVFAHLATRPWFADAHFSFFSEPNCMWVEYDGSSRHFGYQGDAQQYARQYLWTWQAMRPWVRPGQVHLGPWVVEPDHGNPVIDNLPPFLDALRAEFARAREPLPPWSAFAFNLYETPQLALDGFAEYKIAYIRDLLARTFPDRALPIRLDEIGIHPLLGMEFEHDTSVSLASTRWARAWQAEMLALLVDQGIAQAGPWYVATESPAYFAYLAATHVVGTLDLVRAGDHALTLRDGDRPRPEHVAVALASDQAERVGVLRSVDASAESVRAALWQFPRFPETDARLRQVSARPVTVRLPPAPHGWRVTLTVPPGAALPATVPRESIPVSTAGGAASVDRLEMTVADAFTLDLEPAGVVILDARRLP
jgi:hypothetical protein